MQYLLNWNDQQLIKIKFIEKIPNTLDGKVPFDLCNLCAMFLCPGANFKFQENNVIDSLILVKAEKKSHFLSGLHCFF